MHDTVRLFKMAQNKRNGLNQVAGQRFWQNKGLPRVLILAGSEKLVLPIVI